MKKLTSPVGHRLGLDENGLGPRLGPMIVTAVWAQTDEKGARFLSRKLPKKLSQDLNDSKALVSCRNVSLAEAWARGIVLHVTGTAPKSPEELLRLLCLEERVDLVADCPPSTLAQCWSHEHEEFCATDEQLMRILGHINTLAERGVQLRGVQAEVVCTGRLNDLKARGVHRFMADLHAMERLILHFRAEAAEALTATCGKVGGIGKYGPFFGPLQGRLHVALEEGQAQSCYRFPEVGELRFVRDADASDALVMLASLVGKYMRELLMHRVAHFYVDVWGPDSPTPSGYHDPVTAAFVKKTSKKRRQLEIVQDCFERQPAEKKSKRADRVSEAAAPQAQKELW